MPLSTLATLGSIFTFPMLSYRTPPYPALRHILPYPALPSRLYHTSCHRILPITLKAHVSPALTYYSILPYHTLPYPTLNYFTLHLLKLGRIDPGPKRLMAETTYYAKSTYHRVIRPKWLGGSDTWPKIYWLVGTKSFRYLEISVPDSGPQTFRHKDISVPTHWRRTNKIRCLNYCG